MILEIIALTSDVLGKILLGVSALLVHKRLKREQKIDKKVLKELKREQLISIFAIILIVVGYLIHLYLLNKI